MTAGSRPVCLLALGWLASPARVTVAATVVLGNTAPVSLLPWPVSIGLAPLFKFLRGVPFVASAAGVSRSSPLAPQLIASAVTITAVMQTRSWAARPSAAFMVTIIPRHHLAPASSIVVRSQRALQGSSPLLASSKAPQTAKVHAYRSCWLSE